MPEPDHPLNLHHVGWVVRSIDESLPRFLAATAFADLGVEDHGWVKVAFLQAGCSLIELLEPVGTGSDLDEFLAAHGEGIHHLAYGVPDVSRALACVSSRGVRLIDREPRSGARGTQIGFVDGRLPGNVVVEFVADPHLDFGVAHAGDT